MGLGQRDFLARYDALMAQARTGGKGAAEAARQAGALAAGADNSRAEAAFSLALRIDPLDNLPRIALARLAAARGAYDLARNDAAAVFSSALDVADRCIAAFLLGEIAQARGDRKEARQAFEAARQLAEQVHEADPMDAPGAHDLASARQRLAELDLAENDAAGARAGHAAALGLLAALPAEASQADRAFSHARLADLAFAARDLAAARRHASEADQLYSALAAQAPNDPGLAAARASLATLTAAMTPRRGRAEADTPHLAAGRAALAAGELESARRHFADLVRAADQRLAAEPKSVPLMNALALAWDQLADVAAAAQRPSAAQDALARVVALARMADDREPCPTSERNLAGALLRFGAASSDAGDHDRARQALGESYALRTAMAKAAGRTPETLRDVAVSLERLGLARQAAGDANGAARHWEEELALADEIFPRPTPEGLRFRAVICAHLSTLKTLHAAAYKHDALAALAGIARLDALTDRDRRLRALLDR